MSSYTSSTRSGTNVRNPAKGTQIVKATRAKIKPKNAGVSQETVNQLRADTMNRRAAYNANRR